MKPGDIKVGSTYTNRGAGRSQRTVLAIDPSIKPDIWHSSSPALKDEPGVLYRQGSEENVLYLKSFASWCGREIKKNVE